MQTIPITQARQPKPQQQTAEDPVIRKPRLLEIVPLSYATIQRKINNEEFPKPIRLEVNSVGWKLSEVQAWLDSLERAEGVA
ncbi:AlpA family phage regulatory protein [Thiomicrorhabdus sp.]|uniref:helix-turn-helix transcriptional regulator n=1 Tax=Thiomicrorhabdus sp. TaxID=2039724 RepID=UPI0029C93B84|nr:AlpA family phage regulatory protein [Thiomicrorhabdus sp.]